MEEPSTVELNTPLSNKLLELASLFLRFGFTAFGGPAAHVAMLHDEVVTRRKWIDDGRALGSSEHSLHGL
jgi:chromate transporter